MQQTEALVVSRPLPHPGQQKILDSTARFRVVFAGRRFGKTDMGIEALLVGSDTLPGATRVKGIYWWIGLSWRSASMKRAWRLLKQTCHGWAEIREMEKEIHLPNGSQIWMRTAENPESLAGEGVRGVVLDEFTLMMERVWTEFVRATLTDFRGWALFIGIPKGRGWSWQLWSRGIGEKRQAGWQSWQMPTTENPYIRRDEVEQARVDGLSAIMFAQEYEAAIIDDANLVFRNITACLTSAALDAPVPGHSYVAGVDLAKMNDFTVVSVWDETERREVALDRYNAINYSIQKPRIVELCKRFNCAAVIVETNNTGEPIIEDLERDLPVIRFTTTQSTKAAAIESLALAFEQQRLGVLPDEQATLELQGFGMERLPSGAFRYGAVDSMHDDTVMARAFAWSHIAAVGLSGRAWLELPVATPPKKREEEEAA